MADLFPCIDCGKPVHGETYGPATCTGCALAYEYEEGHAVTDETVVRLLNQIRDLEARLKAKG